MAKKKRVLDTTICHENMISDAAIFNTRVLKKLKQSFETNPEADLLSLIPSQYLKRLADKKSDHAASHKQPRLQKEILNGNGFEKDISNDDVRSMLRPSDPIQIIDRLSKSVQQLLARDSSKIKNSLNLEKPALQSISVIELLKYSEVIGKSPVPSRRIVLKCNENTVAKVVWDAEDLTEYTTLQYLQESRLDIPAPKPLGLLCMGRVTIFFISNLPGMTLEAAWASFSTNQKKSVQVQLNDIFTSLRSLPRPEGTPLGGVAGEGCKDQRRHLRRSDRAIQNVADFDNFVFSNPRYGSQMFVTFLRNFSAPSKIVFSHGDLRPENIIVQMSEDKECQVVGLLDWENSGFYPDYHDAIKATNCMATNEDWDWYEFLPPCISPHKYSQSWLLDYIWSKHLE